jgi:hypothetical protein
MKTKQLSLFACILFALLAPVARAQTQAPGQAQRPVLRVSSATELLRAIGPNRVIILEKGDYDLSTAYGVKGPYIQWYDSEDGTELGLSRLTGLTIRGSEGSRILVRSKSVYLLDLSSSAKIELIGLSFVREVEEGRRVTGGGLYLESVEGPNGYPIELRDCSDLRFSRISVKGGFYGALYAATSRGIGLEACEFSGMKGSILVSVEESEEIGFRDCVFVGNSGSTFVDIYTESEELGATTFSSCSFRDNSFEFFSGPGPLPVTADCDFEGNSFGADWAEKSVAPQPHSGSDSYTTPVLQRYEFARAGLGLDYPSSWEIQSGENTQRVGFFSPDGQSMLLFIPLDVSIMTSADPADATTRASFDAALASLVGIMKRDADMKIELGQDAPPAALAPACLAASYSGRGSRPNGSSGSLRARILASGGQLYCLVALAGDPGLIAEGTEAAAILASIGPRASP